jgi:hypothetical protein
MLAMKAVYSRHIIFGLEARPNCSLNFLTHLSITRSYLKNHFDRFGNVIFLSIFQTRDFGFVFLR